MVTGGVAGILALFLGYGLLRGRKDALGLLAEPRREHERRGHKKHERRERRERNGRGEYGERRERKHHHEEH